MSNTAFDQTEAEALAKTVEYKRISAEIQKLNKLKDELKKDLKGYLEVIKENEHVFENGNKIMQVSSTTERFDLKKAKEVLDMRTLSPYIKETSSTKFYVK